MPLGHVGRASLALHFLARNTTVQAEDRSRFGLTFKVNTTTHGQHIEEPTIEEIASAVSTTLSDKLINAASVAEVRPLIDS